MRLLIATTNPGKIAEYRELLADTGLETIGLDELRIGAFVEETGATFEENARLKALAYSNVTGLPTLADDSGLCVDALDGSPGVHSARYGSDTQARIQRLLAELATAPEERRAARFVCVIALAQPTGAVVTFEGVCEGRISRVAKGSNGFGYDPIFYLPEYGRTMAELPVTLKNRTSHRARAVARLKEWLARNPLHAGRA